MSGAYSRAALIRVAALNRSFTVLVVKSGFTWTLTKVFPGCEYWRVTGYNGKMSVKILTFKFLSLKTLRKKKSLSLPKTKSLQPRIEPGFTCLIGPLTTTLARQHNRRLKKFNYTNTIKHIFVIKSVTGVSDE